MHIAIIPDGNRRWAKKHNKTPSEGHLAGMENAKKLMKKARELGIKYLTFYVFSSENLKKRPPKEKLFLITKIGEFLKKMAEGKEVKENRIRINILGRIEKLPKKIQEIARYAMEKTKKYTKYYLNLCIVYDGRDEIVDAVKEIIKKKIRKIDRRTIKKHLYTRDMPPPDLIIRTGMKKEKRLSAFLLWDSAYSEFYFTGKYFPDFKPRDLEKAVEDFKGRERRYGK